MRWRKALNIKWTLVKKRSILQTSTSLCPYPSTLCPLSHTYRIRTIWEIKRDENFYKESVMLLPNASSLYGYTTLASNNISIVYPKATCQQGLEYADCIHCSCISLPLLQKGHPLVFDTKNITTIKYCNKWISSLYCAISAYLPGPLTPPLSIIHRFRLVFKATSCISTNFLYVDSSWSSYLCSSMWEGPQEYVHYEFVRTSPAVSHMTGSF